MKSVKTLTTNVHMTIPMTVRVFFMLSGFKIRRPLLLVGWATVAARNSTDEDTHLGTV